MTLLAAKTGPNFFDEAEMFAELFMVTRLKNKTDEACRPKCFLQSKDKVRRLNALNSRWFLGAGW